MYKFLLKTRQNRCVMNEDEMKDNSSNTIFLIFNDTVACYTPEEFKNTIFNTDDMEKFYRNDISYGDLNQRLLHLSRQEKDNIFYPWLKEEERKNINVQRESTREILGIQDNIRLSQPIVYIETFDVYIDGSDLRYAYTSRFNTIHINIENPYREDIGTITELQTENAVVYRAFPIDRKAFVDNGEFIFNPQNVPYNLWGEPAIDIPFPKVINFKLEEFEEQVFVLHEMSEYQRRYLAKKSALEEQRKKQRVQDARAYEVKIGDANQLLFNAEETERNAFVDTFNLQGRLDEWIDEEKRTDEAINAERARLVEERKTGLEAITARYLDQREAMQAREQEAFVEDNKKKDEQLQKDIEALDKTMMAEFTEDEIRDKQSYIKFKGIFIADADIDKIYSMLMYKTEILLVEIEENWGMNVYHLETEEEKQASPKEIIDLGEDFPKSTIPKEYSVINVEGDNITYMTQEEMESYIRRHPNIRDIRELFDRGVKDFELIYFDDRHSVIAAKERIAPPYTIVNDIGERETLSATELKDFVEVNPHIKKLKELYDEGVRNFEIVRINKKNVQNNSVEVVYIARPLSQLAVAPKDILSHISSFVDAPHKLSAALITRKDNFIESNEILPFLDYFEDGNIYMKEYLLGDTPILGSWALRRKFKMPKNIDTIEVKMAVDIYQWQYQSIIFYLFFDKRIYGLKKIIGKRDGMPDIIFTDSDKSIKRICIFESGIIYKLNPNYPPTLRMHMHYWAAKNKKFIEDTFSMCLEIGDTIVLETFLKNFPTYEITINDIKTGYRITKAQVEILKRYGKYEEFIARRKEFILGLIQYHNKRELEQLDIDALEKIYKKEISIEEVISMYISFIQNHTAFPFEENVLQQNTENIVQNRLINMNVEQLDRLFYINEQLLGDIEQVVEAINFRYEQIINTLNNYDDELSLVDNIENMNKTNEYLEFLIDELYREAGMPRAAHQVVVPPSHMFMYLFDVINNTAPRIISAKKAEILGRLQQVVNDLRRLNEDLARNAQEDITYLTTHGESLTEYEVLLQRYLDVLAEETEQRRPAFNWRDNIVDVLEVRNRLGQIQIVRNNEEDFNQLRELYNRYLELEENHVEQDEAGMLLREQLEEITDRLIFVFRDDVQLIREQRLEQEREDLQEGDIVQELD